MRWPRPLFASIVFHMMGGFALLMSWPKAEIASPRISTYVVFAKDKGTKETQVDVKDKGAGSGTIASRVRPNSPKVARNGLLAHKDNVDLTPKPDFFAKSLEIKPREPDLREPKHDANGWTSEIKRDGKVEFTDKPLFEPPTLVAGKNGGFRFRFRIPDINEIVMHLRGDPMYDPQKRNYLKNTKEMREAMAREFIRENLAQSLEDLGDRLTALWFDESLSIEAKRQRLFEIWEECAEEGSDAVLAISELIRVSIQSFIKNNMPKGTALAYTDNDLSRLNKSRSSKAEFKPY